MVARGRIFNILSHSVVTRLTYVGTPVPDLQSEADEAATMDTPNLQDTYDKFFHA